jgi:hypothetical protein
MDLFSKCYARIERAIEHSNRMAELWNGARLRRLVDFRVEVDRQGRGTMWLDENSLEIPLELELELGEFLYQLRAALDGSVYACAIEDSGTDPPPNISTIEFPICAKRGDWRGQARKIAALNAGRRRFIELMQPFEEPDLSPELRIGNFNRSLRFLNDLARIDRHRTLHSWCTAVVKLKPLLRLPEGVKLKEMKLCHVGNLEGGPLATFVLTGWKPMLKISANPNVDLNISIRESEPPCFSNDYLSERLRSMVRSTRLIILALQKNKWKDPPTNSPQKAES